MRYSPACPTSRAACGPDYNRAGSPHPDAVGRRPNAGFSTPRHRLYLPVDPAPDRPTVAAQRADDGSLLHLVRRLIALRRANPGAGPGRRRRGPAPGLSVRLPCGAGAYLVVVNPQQNEACYAYAPSVHSTLEAQGVEFTDGTIIVQDPATGS